MRFGMGLPQMTQEAPVDALTVREVAMTAEEEGYDSLWVMETGVRRGDAPAELAAISLLSYAAALTNRVRLGTSVLLPGLRNPVWLAQDLTSIDRLSGGRLILGLGLGNAARAELLGIPREEWPGRFEESLEVLRSLWSPGVAEFSGRYWDVAGLGLEPKPIQEPHPPIWFGAHAPGALARAARLGSGWMGAGASSTDTFVSQLALLRGYLEAEGRGRDDFAISKRVYVAVDDDAGRAEERVRAFFDAFYRNPDLGSTSAVFGPVAKCVEEIGALYEAGAEMLLLNPMFDYMEQLEALTGHVLPQLP